MGTTRGRGGLRTRIRGSPPAQPQPGLGRCGDAEGPALGAAAPAPFCPHPARVHSGALPPEGWDLSGMARSYAPCWPQGPTVPLMPGRAHRGPFQERPQPPAQSGPWDPRQACLLWSASRLHPQLPGATWQNPWTAADKQQRAALPPRLQGPSLLPSQLAILGGPRPVDAPAPPVPLSSRGLPSPVFCVQISFF